MSTGCECQIRSTRFDQSEQRFGIDNPRGRVRQRSKAMPEFRFRIKRIAHESPILDTRARVGVYDLCTRCGEKLGTSYEMLTRPSIVPNVIGLGPGVAGRLRRRVVALKAISLTRRGFGVQLGFPGLRRLALHALFASLLRGYSARSVVSVRFARRDPCFLGIKR